MNATRTASQIYTAIAILAFLLFAYFLAFYFGDYTAGAAAIIAVVGLVYLYRGVYGSEEEFAKAMHQPYTIFQEHGLIGGVIFFIITASGVFSFVSLSVNAAGQKYAGEAVGKILPTLPIWAVVIALVLVALQYRRFKMGRKLRLR